MMFPVSSLAWEIVFPIQIMQFPWRFLLPVTFCVATVIALSLSDSSTSLRRLLNASLAVLATLAATAYGSYATGRDIQRRTAPVQIGESWDSSEYRTLWNRQMSLPSTAKLFQSNADKVLASEGAAITIEKWLPNEKRVTVSSIRDATLLLRMFYFPGNQAASPAGPVVLRPDPVHGLVECSVPSGLHTITFRRVKTVEEKIGWLVSLVSFMGLVLSFLLLKRGKVTQP
jgi:hypothetical protein